MAADIDAYLTEELAQDLASAKVVDRSSAVAVLGRLGRTERTLDVLRRLADADPDESVRQQAREQSRELWSRIRDAVAGELQVVAGDPPALDLAAFERALAAPTAMVRMQAVLDALPTGDPRLLAPVLARMDAESDDWVLATLVRAIGQLGNATHVPRVQRFLNHEGARRVVANTVEAIATMDPEAGFTLLVPLLSADDSRVRASAINAMVSTQKEAAFDTLRAMARSPRAHARESALSCLKRIPGEDAEQLLLDMLIAEPDGDLAGRIAGCVAAQGTRAAAQRLAPIVAREPNRAHHDQLARCLGGLKERLAIPEGELAEWSLGAVVMPAAPAPIQVPGPIARKTARMQALSGKTGRVSVVAAEPPAGPWKRRGAILCGAGVAAALVALAVESGAVVSPEAAARAKVTGTTLATVAAAPSPAKFVNQVVAWEGEVVGVDAESGSVKLERDGTLFSATLARVDATRIARGTRLRVIGRIVGRSRLGPVYLEGVAAEKP